MNFRRGNESQKHRRAKKLIAAKLAIHGYTTFPEHKLCDIAAIRRSHERVEILCVEFETQSRTCTSNILRNFGNGAHRCITVCDTTTVKAAVLKKFQRSLSAEILAKTTLMTFEEFLITFGASCEAPISNEQSKRSQLTQQNYDRCSSKQNQ